MSYLKKIFDARPKTQYKKNTVKVIDPDIIEAAVAWAEDKISLAEFTEALKLTSSNTAYATLARALKEYIKNK